MMNVMMNVLSDLLVPAAMCPHLEASSSSDVIEILAAKLLGLGKVKASFAQAVLDREARMPTGLPLGEINVAIPHTDPEHVIETGVAMASLNTPVGFCKMDKPDEEVDVRLVFVLARKDKTLQLDLLQNVAGLIQSPEVLKRLAEAGRSEEMIALLV